MALLSADAVDGFLANPDRIKRLMEEMAVGRQLAAKIHRSLLPSPVRHPQIDVDVRYLPIDIVSGNYCQFRFPVPKTCYNDDPPNVDKTLIVAEVK